MSSSTKYCTTECKNQCENDSKCNEECMDYCLKQNNSNFMSDLFSGWKLFAMMSVCFLLLASCLYFVFKMNTSSQSQSYPYNVNSSFNPLSSMRPSGPMMSQYGQSMPQSGSMMPQTGPYNPYA